MSKLKGERKRKQDEGSSSSSQAQTDTSTSLFVVIVSFLFIFFYTCSFQFIVMFYLAYVMFLLVLHSGLSTATGADSWSAAQPGAALDSDAAHGLRGGGSRGARGS
jgi:hypothetical protein